jgi:serine/threonine-protein kinase
MGVVYEAADDALERTVALKIIAPELAADADFRARFTREARSQAALDSPHVVHVYAHGEVDGRLYLATQLVPDGDLGSMLRRFGPPPPAIAAELMAQVAAGLADAHAAGMVHRDLKPANILLRRRGSTMSVYLTDFGIAQQLHAGDADPDPGGTAGTPSYMAPELHTGGEPGVDSDVYALGCLIWATLTGHAPYRGTEQQVVNAHLEQPVPQLPDDSPLAAALNSILRTAMAKDPADRYGSAATLRDHLRRARALPSALVPPPQRVRRTPLLVAVAAAVVGLAIGGVWWGISRDDEPAARTTGRPETSAAPRDATAAATRSLADALLEQGLLTEEQARCTAARWIEEAGLDRMVDDGLFDDQMRFVDLPAAQMSAETRTAAAAATLACATY